MTLDKIIPDKKISTTIAPWLSIRNGSQAVDFYKAAFGAVEAYRFEDPDGAVVARLSVDGAEFWVAGEAPQQQNLSADLLPESSVRMILTVADPDTLFAQALKAGASRVYPVSEEHGWRVGRLADPFGLHWEIGRPPAEG